MVDWRGWTAGFPLYVWHFDCLAGSNRSMENSTYIHHTIVKVINVIGMFVSLQNSSLKYTIINEYKHFSMPSLVTLLYSDFLMWTCLKVYSSSRGRLMQTHSFNSNINPIYLRWGLLLKITLVYNVYLGAKQIFWVFPIYGLKRYSKTSLLTLGLPDGLEWSWIFSAWFILLLCKAFNGKR